METECNWTCHQNLACKDLNKAIKGVIIKAYRCSLCVWDIGGNRRGCRKAKRPFVDFDVLSKVFSVFSSVSDGRMVQDLCN